jgi:xanthine dehydrogenase YagR molybdenum-binding subunit
MAERSPLGGSVNRVDGRLKVTGSAKYAADYDVDGVCHGYLVLSTVGQGTIETMDTSAAEASPGVLAVYTPFNPLALTNAPGGGNPNWVPLQDTEIRHYGQIIGLVVAETFEQARHAARQVRVGYAARPPAASFVDGIPNATVPGGQAVVDILAEGVASIDDALAASEVTVSGTYQQPPKHHHAMEPHAVLAVWQDDQLTAYTGSQAPISHAQRIASVLGLDPAQVRVISQHVGGGFGNKASTWTHDLVTAAAARALGRPVKTVLTREQTFTITGHRSAVAQTVTLGAARDGTLIALKHDAYSSLSTSGWTYESAPGTTSRMLYQTANLHVGQKVVTLDVPPSTVMRAPGEESGSFALECAMDELADALRMDPVALRMKNYATVLPGRGVPWSSKHLDECYQVGVEMSGWSRRNPVPRSVIDGDWLVGMGMATAVYPANRFRTTVRVRLQADGTASVATATADLGTGMWTVLSIMGADSLGLPLHRIRPDLGDSTLPRNTGAFGSSSTASVASALRAAADSAKQALIQLAVENERSPLYGLSPDDVSYQDGDLVAPGRRAGFAAVLEATGTAAVEGTGNDSGGDASRYAFHSFGAHFCEIRVNRWTGEPRLSRITTVIDAGRIVNQKTARSQIAGGVIFGIGQALLEGARVEPATGRIANTNLMDYLLPVNLDVPPIDVHFVEYPDTVFNPVGVRGIGELGTVGVAAAIANAVYNATGLRVRELPITLDKLLS